MTEMAESITATSTNHDGELILVKDRYKQMKILGRGSYGEVWLVSPLESSPGSKSKPTRCVLKRVSIGRSNNEKEELAAAEREAQLLSSLKHPNIVAYIESFRSRDHHLNIVMAFCEGGDLYTKLKLRKKQLLSEEQIVEWFIQITLALQYMHDRSILHRDLKTQNIFLTKNEIVKLGDLGIARILENNGADLATTVIGTPYYMSPEIFSNQPYGQKSDIWALGCCVYEMATLEHAFKAGDISSLVMKIVRGQTPTLPSAEAYSTPLIELINAMLDKEAVNRPTAKEIIQKPYIKQHIVRLYNKTSERCRSFQRVPSAAPLVCSASSVEIDHHSMPPLPKPRSVHSSHADMSVNEGERSITPPISEPRARRIRQRMGASDNEISALPSPVAKIVNANEQKAKNFVNNAFIEKIRQNDTLARFKRDSESPSISESHTDDSSIPRSNLSARQRRRQQKDQSGASVMEDIERPPSTPPIYDRSISHDSQIESVEQERKAKNEMNDFLNELDATLHVPASPAPSASAISEVPSMFDRTMMSTAKIQELHEALIQHCLKEIPREKLKRALDLVDRVVDTDIKRQMIGILGEEIYEKYSAQIHYLKFYENSLKFRQ